MKLNLLNCCIIAVCTSFSVLSQSNHSKIIEAYGEERFQSLQNSNPGMIELLDNYIDHGIKLIDMHEKYVNEQLVSSIPLRSKDAHSISVEEFVNNYETEGFNPLLYSFFPSDVVQIFVLGATNKVLIIESQKNLLN